MFSYFYLGFRPRKLEMSSVFMNNWRQINLPRCRPLCSIFLPRVYRLSAEKKNTRKKIHQDPFSIRTRNMKFIQLTIQARILIFIYSKMKKRDSQRYHLADEESRLHSKWSRDCACNRIQKLLCRIIDAVTPRKLLRKSERPKNRTFQIGEMPLNSSCITGHNSGCAPLSARKHGGVHPPRCDGCRLLLLYRSSIHFYF